MLQYLLWIVKRTLLKTFCYLSWNLMLNQHRKTVGIMFWLGWLWFNLSVDNFSRIGRGPSLFTSIYYCYKKLSVLVNVTKRQR